MARYALQGLRILITGATGDIGSAIVRAIARDGGRPIIHYGSNASRAQQLANEVGADEIVSADLQAADGARALWQTCTSSDRCVDAIVLNAGRRSIIPPDSDWKDWHAAWSRDNQINLQANADLSRLACAHFTRRQKGKVLAIASRAGQRGYSWDAVPYGVTKAGLISLIKSIALTYGQQGVVATAIAPGWVNSEMARTFIKHHGSQAALSEIPTGSMVDLTELGELTAFLLRPTQRSINGATIDLNGGSYIR